VRERLLDTAREQFAARGYSATSTKSIAVEAGASERLIFSYFETKRGLFQAAVLEPFGEFIEHYTRSFDEQERSSTLSVETARYVEGMYDLFDRHRQLVQALVGARAPERDSLDDPVTAVFAALLRPIEELAAAEARRRGLSTVDPPLMARATLGMVMTLAAFDDLFYDRHNPRPARRHVIDQLTTLLITGYDGFR
jgi:AcrR family transcriptional regulator